MSRRRFMQLSAESSLAAAEEAAAVWRTPASAAAETLERVDSVPTNITRTWLAPQYWANRLGDWRLSNGRFESLVPNAGGRTIGVLTRSLATGDLPASVSVRTGTLAGGVGFSGFVVGAGAGALDWRAAALVMGASGEGGGFLAVYDSDGQVRFREHTDETRQFNFAPLSSTNRSGPQPPRSLNEDVTLRLDIVPVGAGKLDLTLTARATATGALLSTVRRLGVPDRDLIGGLSLISSARGGGTTARHWFRELRTGGGKIARHDRSAGPVLGTLHSLAGGVLKLTAQLMPIGSSDPQQVVLQIRPAGGTAWSTAQTTSVGGGYAALFRVTGWDVARDWEFRVGFAVGTPQESFYAGEIRRPPVARTVSIATVNCTVHSFRNLDVGSRGRFGLPGETNLGLYTSRNLYFPYADSVQALRDARPDLLVALGDQYYENKPTKRVDTEMDVLFKYFLWLWALRDLTRNTPTICLVDDHDMFHANLWGWSGRPAPGGDANLGGYRMPASWVNTVQRVQCSHNPDAYNPTPVLQNISVYYTAFSYGGVSFAVLEDRKFKNTNQPGVDESGAPLQPPRDLLGARQEAFLTAWRGMHPGQPKVCLTQTLFGCLQTNPDGVKMFDADCNGTPVNGRRTAVTLLKQARALILSGDQHLASVVRHGIDQFTDGPVQFTGPALGSAWQRWFAPTDPLPNASGPNTGDFTDAYGSRMRVLAVANPKVTFAQLRAVQTATNDIGDRNLKCEGFAIVEVDPTRREHRLHCWPWNQRPTVPGATEFPGWPRTVPFDAL